jgi:O-antigen/teichoic acid export membrane protein
MTDFDLDRLGDVWRQQPDPAEMERLQKTAATVARRARLSQILDVLTAVAVSAVVVFLVASNPKLDTLLIGAAAILVMLASSIRLRKVRQVELRNLTGSTEDMLDQSIDRVETTLRYRRFSLMAVGPALVAGLLVAYFARGGALFAHLGDWPLLRILWVLIAVFVIVTGMGFAWRALRRGNKELERLRAMREAYRRESESTGS